MECHRDELLRIAISQSSKGHSSKSLKQYSEAWQRIECKMELFMDYMYKHNDGESVSVTMQVLKNTLLKLIKNKQVFPKDMFNLVYLHQSRREEAKSLWKTCELKLASVLNIDTLYKNTADWYWFREVFLNAPFWLDTVKRGEVNVICPCGARMDLTSPQTVYAAFGANCDDCRSNIRNDGDMYHCNAGQTDAHAQGYDYCIQVRTQCNTVLYINAYIRIRIRICVCVVCSVRSSDPIVWTRYVMMIWCAL